MKLQSAQMPLKITPHNTLTFENFYPANNQQIVAQLKELITPESEQFVYLWGLPSAGKTHLLQACCNYANTNKTSAIYIPFADATNMSPRALENLTNISLICLDDIDNILKKTKWETALFELFNQLSEHKNKLVITANGPPQSLKYKLPDLQSRLTSCVVFQVHSLTDEQKLVALKKRAKNSGLELPTNVAEYLLSYYSRDPKILFRALKKLDQASLISQRKLTIPFIKTVLLS